MSRAEPPDPRAIHELDPTGRFSDRAADYAVFRPSYPASAIDAVLDGLGDPTRLACADLGAGTGISSRLLADRGLRVFAIEPNRAMRDAASPHRGVVWVDATAEATTLPDRGVDLVVAAQSFHWFHLERAVAEILRILVPRGRFAMLYNERAAGHPVADAYERLVKEASTLAPQRLRFGSDFPDLLARSGFLGFRDVTFAGGQSLDAEGLVGRARSASYVPREGPAWARLEAGLRALHAAHAGPNGRVFVPQTTRVLLADAPAASGA